MGRRKREATPGAENTGAVCPLRKHIPQTCNAGEPHNEMRKRPTARIYETGGERDARRSYGHRRHRHQARRAALALTERP